MTPEEVRCFCEAKGATVRVETPAGTFAFSPSGIQIGPTVFSWESGPLPLASPQEILGKAETFTIVPKFGDAREVSREKLEQLLKM
jgi:hypothetical protein